MSGEQQRCADCGEYVFFNHHMWSSGADGGRTTHGPLDSCERAREALARMPVGFDAAIQVIVEIAELLGVFVSSADDAEYDDPKRLQALLLQAYGLASDGIRDAPAALHLGATR